MSITDNGSLPAWRLLPDEVRTEIDQEVTGFCRVAIPDFDPRTVMAHLIFAVALWCIREHLAARRDRTGGRTP